METREEVLKKINWDSPYTDRTFKNHCQKISYSVATIR
jgi:hypothetical protein